MFKSLLELRDSLGLWAGGCMIGTATKEFFQKKASDSEWSCEWSCG